MSRGTTLTLYKKYNIAAEQSRIDKIVDRYTKSNRDHDWSEKKKDLSEYRKDIPIVIHDGYGIERNVYDKKTKTWVDKRPPVSLKTIKDGAFGYIDVRDGLCCEQLMEWSFGSQFDCLVEKFNLNAYKYSTSTIEITHDMAVEMLAAINYILGGEWSDSVERGMNNPYIETFTSGGSCDSYWKYVYRNKNRGKSKTFRIKQDGYDITVKCPVEKKKKKDGDEDDFDYETELDESNRTVEWNLENFRNALIAFLKSDNWSRHDDPNEWIGYDSRNQYKYLLTYEYWG